MAYSINAKDYFKTLLYSGNSTARSLTGVGFAPSFVWIKERTSTSDHMLFDQPRGVQKYISSNLTNAEQTSAGMLTSFDSDGFSLGSGNDTNDNGQTYVSWNWKGNGAGSSNSDGSITSTVSANTTAGISIVTGTQNASGSWTVGHGLGVVPSFYMVKTTGATSDWYLWHRSLGGATDGGKFLRLNNVAVSPANDSTVWNNTAPTSSVFSMGSNIWNDSATFVAYCFAEKTGFSKFGKYTGNGQQSDNAFVYTGFKPAFVIIKRQDQSTDWVMFDTARDTYNVGSKVLLPNNSASETSGSQKIDFLSNGFKIRSSGNNTGDSSPYIYMCFASASLVGSNNVPANAH